MPCDPVQALRERGLQVTAQRIAVLNAVSRFPHCTADDVAEGVRSELGSISKQAVYDALAALSENGLIRRIQPAGSVARYEDRVGDNHHHMICRVCGITADIDCSGAGGGKAPCLKPPRGRGIAGFKIDEAEVIYWGTCRKCLETRSKSPSHAQSFQREDRVPGSKSTKSASARPHRR